LWRLKLGVNSFFSSGEQEVAMAASNAVSKRMDPEMVEHDATPLGKGRLREVVAGDTEVNRFHNREDLSPEAMSRALAELKETVESLEERVAAAEVGSASIAGTAKGLGKTMLSMGDSLAKRISNVEEAAEAAAETAAEAAKAAAEMAAAAAQPAAQPQPQPALFAAAAARPAKNRRFQMVLGVGAAVVIAAAAGFFLRPHASPTSAPPTQALYSPDAPAPHS
jgi:hypothetical protein